MTENLQTSIRLRLTLKPGMAIGPGKVAILRSIQETGSISAAGRLIGMSYKRSWQLVDSLNNMFEGPLVQTSKGGQHGGGARLTPLGEKVLALYERILDNTLLAIAPDLRTLKQLSAPSSNC
ncbi:MAG: winged helix-turn-helix domain-containing protein [Pseudomonadales bacterium]|nr:winged helix-turn-helix domain-containing protein [Pseudomonadales bacterium]